MTRLSQCMYCKHWFTCTWLGNFPMVFWTCPKCGYRNMTHRDEAKEAQ